VDLLAGEELRAMAKEVIVQPLEIVSQIRKLVGGVAIAVGFKQISSSENTFVNVAEHFMLRENAGHRLLRLDYL